MSAVLPLLLLAAMGAKAPSDAPDPAKPTYKTAKSIRELERCLVDELSDLGEVTFIPLEGNMTLMIRNGEAKPLLIDIAPPTVTVTTSIRYDTRVRIERCI
jgi:hypothetical protein